MNNKASSTLAVVGAFGAGMLAMYLADPARGGIRRTLAGAAAGDFARRASARLRDTGEDFSDRTADYLPDEFESRTYAARHALRRAPAAAAYYVGEHKAMVAATLAAAAGIAVLVRALSSDKSEEGQTSKGVHIDKDMFIAAPPERVFEFWRQQDNLAKHMRHVKEISRAGNDRWHWKVSGPLGSTVEWDAVITQEVENRTLAWESAPGASVDSRGRVEFQPQGGGTRLHVSMDYTPPAGKLGDAVARLFGKDARSEMDDDLMRIKSALESGSATSGTGTGTSDLSRPSATGGESRPIH